MMPGRHWWPAVLALLLLTTAGPRPASAQTAPPARFDHSQCPQMIGSDWQTTSGNWNRCRQDADCMVAANICGWPRGLNRRHEVDQLMLNMCVGPMVDCVSPPARSDWPDAARCVAGRCVVPDVPPAD